MAGRAKGPLRIAIEDFLETWDLFKPLKKLLTDLGEWTEDELLGVYASLATRLGVVDILPPEYKPASIASIVKSAPAGGWVALTGIVGLLLGGFMGISAPIRRRAEYSVDEIQRTHKPDISTALQMWRRGSISDEALEGLFNALGVTDYQKPAYKRVSEQLLNPLQLETLRLRKKIGEGVYDDEMTALGFTNERKQQVQDLVQQIPSPQDLVQMAVREAWDEGVVSRFQYDAGFPPEFSEWMVKQGFTPEWAKRYWRAHWQLPGLSSGYEMFHRLRPGETDTPFTEADLETLLRTADVPEFFRKRLIAISYAPYTRVDVRRMFATGVLTKDEVYKAYRDLGYNDERAQKLTEFTTTIERAEEKGLTREAVTGGYKRGITSRTDAVSMLAEIGYKAEEADYWLDLIDYDLQAAATDAQLDVIKSQFVNWQIDETTLTAKLAPLNLPSDRQQQLVTLWNISRLNKAAAPTKAELEKFYSLDLLTLDEMREYLRRDGYQPREVELYISRIDKEQAADALKEQERAAKEADRLQASAKASELAKARAALDVDIADRRVTIADIKVALHGDLTPAEVKELGDLQVQVMAEIARIQLEKAKLKAA